ncbi:MAG TPA: BTAD domain-containing putative transcriptional regulator, partial [Roseiflexaceae bacterium]|nr:BTAD domain-containing putative transcriptional regulator [Roseiflexaceae bacterium]
MSTPFLLSTRDSVQFNVASGHELDARSFELLLAACATHSHRRIDQCAGCAQRLERAAQLYQGDFLAQFMLDDATPFEDWLRPQRERFRQSAIDAYVTLAAFSEGRGDYAAAANRIQQLLDLDPWNEVAYRSLMRVLGLDGQRSAALAVYRRCRDTLAAELGVEPESETQALYESLRASSGQASIKATITTPKSAPTQSLPAALTPFVGREQELHAIGDLLSDRRCRLVTLHGPGGVGKTRLALQAALENAEMYADGVWFVSLAHLLAPALLVPTIADALNVPLRGSGPPLTQLQQAVQSKNSLLVLDNFEQLVEEAPVLSELLRAAPNLSMIVTSRERLALQSEWVIEISGLTVPIAGRDDDIAQSSAGQLWIQTAQRARHGYALSESDYAAVGQICRLVEGMPLAIELAAAWVSERSPATIAAEVAQQATRLTTPWRDVHERHRSFDAVLAHSWSMLGHAEQRVLSRLSVFRGGVAHSAAIQVANASDQQLEALVKKSLLRLISTSAEDQRYELHEITRQYAAEQLDAAGESQYAAEQHLAYVVALTAEANRFWGGAEESAWVARLETEHANIRSALEWAFKAECVREALLVCCAIWRFWQVRSHIDEGRRWLKRVLREAETGLEQTTSLDGHLCERALAYKGAGVLAWEHSDYPDAATCFEQSFALYEALDDHE